MQIQTKVTLSKKVKIGTVQMSCTKEPKENLAKAIKGIREAAARGAQVVCLQELFTSLYFCDVEDYENFKLAEAIPGPSTESLSAVAKELGVVIIASLFEKRTEGLYHNTTAVIDADGKYLGKYRKMHIPDDPAYYEKFYFTPGDLGYKVFKTKFATIGILICWDQWYPEASRITALMGAEVLFYPTAIGWATSQDEATNVEQYGAWQTIQRSHAVANGLHVVSVNRVGFEQNGAMKFWGGSFIANPLGSILYQASAFNAAGRVFAPRYRQAHLNSFFTKDKKSANIALDTAYTDVLAAFRYYLKHWNQGRPIVLAGHSQGALHTMNLIREMVEGTPLESQLVAAYIVGWPVREDFYKKFKPCQTAEQTDCYCTWRTWERNFGLRLKADQKTVCTNPLTWATTTNTYAPKTLNKGGVIRPFEKIYPQVTDAEVHKGILLARKPKFKGSFLFRAKNYHVGDLNLYYLNVRENAQARTKAFLRR